jgi:predicted transcriptional regulator
MDFDRMNERESFLAAIREGLVDAEAGRLIEDEEVERILDEEFGPLEPR